MRTRPATPAQRQAYALLQRCSANYANVVALAQRFYANGASWVGIEDLAPQHAHACRAWDEEQARAGFHIGQTGLRIIVRSRAA